MWLIFVLVSGCGGIGSARGSDVARNIYGTGAKGKATRMHAAIIRARGECQHCGRRDGQMECAHIVGRSNGRLRCDLTNAVCLCHQCHFRFTVNPLKFKTWLRELLGDDEVDRLEREGWESWKQPPKWWEDRVAELEPTYRAVCPDG